MDILKASRKPCLGVVFGSRNLGFRRTFASGKSEKKENLMKLFSKMNGGRFTAESSRSMSKKRKKVFGKEERSGWQKKKILVEAKKAASESMTSFRTSLFSKGSNGSIKVAGMERVLEKMKLDRRSHFVDFGCGNGTVLMYVAKRYGCRVTGIECKEELVKMALENIQKERLKRTKVIRGDILLLNEDWLREIGATHVFAFDGVFRSEDWNYLFHSLIAGGSERLVGASCSRFKNYWPDCIEKCGESVTIGLTGSKSTFSCGVWRLKRE